MKFKNSILAIIAMLAVAATASAQHPLPAQHQAAHSQLLANQRSVRHEMNTVSIVRSVESLRQREAVEEIYAEYWDDQSVNPYGSKVSIPETREINVAEGVVPVRGSLTSPYGWRSQFGRMHRGVDLSLRVGDSVRSAFSGKVRLCKYEGKGYGYYVVVRHDNGMETVYGHLSRFLCKPGQRVKAGDVIALGGNTGRSTGPHLHFETRYLGLPVNPEWIFDFEHRTTHQDLYTFDHDQYRAAQVSRPGRSSKSARQARTKSLKKSGRRSSSLTASARTSKSKKSAASRRSSRRK